MTYAAGLDAVTIIWIAKRFTEEHRAAVDWLNRITDSKFNFFGIEIEVYKIGESDPAPLFQLVSKPNDWSKAVKISASSQELTPAKAINLDYWQAMVKYFEQQGTFLKCQSPLPQHWANFAIGKSDFWMSAIHSVSQDFIRVEVTINKADSKSVFNLMRTNYEELSKEQIHNDIVWFENPEKRASLVYLRKEVNVTDRDKWQNQHQWLLEYLEKFDKFFRPRIKTLTK